MVVCDDLLLYEGAGAIRMVQEIQQTVGGDVVDTGDVAQYGPGELAEVQVGQVSLRVHDFPFGFPIGEKIGTCEWD